MALHNQVGKIGEEIAVKYLIKKGFSIIQRNFNCRGGEIDIICQKSQDYINKAVVSCETPRIKNFSKNPNNSATISCETANYLNKDRENQHTVSCETPNFQCKSQINGVSCVTRLNGNQFEYRLKSGGMPKDPNYVSDNLVKSNSKKIYFVEVKAKSVNSFEEIKYIEKDVFVPENNFSYVKKQRILKAIKYYLFKNQLNLDINCEVMLIIVYVHKEFKQGKVKLYETAILRN